MRLMLATVLCFVMGYAIVPQPADACGVKLTTRATNVPNRSAHPARVHLMGIEGDRALQRALRRAGHEVVVSERAGDIGASSDVVLTTQARLSTTRDALPRNIVLPAAGNARRILAAIEEQLERRAAANPS